MHRGLSFLPVRALDPSIPVCFLTWHLHCCRITGASFFGSYPLPTYDYNDWHLFAGIVLGAVGGAVAVCTFLVAGIAKAAARVIKVRAEGCRGNGGRLVLACTCSSFLCLSVCPKCLLACFHSTLAVCTRTQRTLMFHELHLGV
jgi:hypothetical protein